MYIAYNVFMTTNLPVSCLNRHVSQTAHPKQSRLCSSPSGSTACWLSTICPHQTFSNPFSSCSVQTRLMRVPLCFRRRAAFFSGFLVNEYPGRQDNSFRAFGMLRSLLKRRNVLNHRYFWFTVYLCPYREQCWTIHRFVDVDADGEPDTCRARQGQHPTHIQQAAVVNLDQPTNQFSRYSCFSHLVIERIVDRIVFDDFTPRLSWGAVIARKKKRPVKLV